MTIYRLIQNNEDSDMVEAYYLDEDKRRPYKYLAFIISMDLLSKEITDLLDEDAVDIEFTIKEEPR